MSTAMSAAQWHPRGSQSPPEASSQAQTPEPPGKEQRSQQRAALEKGSPAGRVRQAGAARGQQCLLRARLNS